MGRVPEQFGGERAQLTASNNPYVISSCICNT
jgi:hypothetical protein